MTGASCITVSERPGSDRSISVTSLADHPGALPDATVIRPTLRGKAVPVRLLMSTDQPFIVASDEDGAYTACVPTVDMLHGGNLLVGTTEEPLTSAEGGPVRLIVTDGSTLCWNVKHVASLRAVPERVPDSIPDNPSH